MPAEFSGALDLPNFSDRLPDLVAALRQTGGELQQSVESQSYIPYWEDLYAASHGLKGILKLLNSPESISQYVIRLTEVLQQGLAGNFVCRRVKEAGAVFLEMASRLDSPEPEKECPVLMGLLEKLEALYIQDLPHEERAKDVPSHLFYVNELVSKKAREIALLGLNHCVVEDEILLEEIPMWRTQLDEALQSQEFGKGIVVNFLPFISPEGSRKLKVWAWVAAATHSRAALKQRVKEVMPKVAITKL